MPEDARATRRIGVVALLGLPNAGKSTLLNRLLGEKLAIVTRKAQTTRSRILGILTRDDAQILLLDTPGVHAGRDALAESMARAVQSAVEDCDLALLLVDLGYGWEPPHEALRSRLTAGGVPVLVAGTKSDARRGGVWPPPAEGLVEVREISATTGEGVDALLEALIARLPEGPLLYPEDELTDRPLRFLAAELIREAAFDALQEEIPYQLAVDIRSFDESDPANVRIEADLVVGKSSHKRIAVGAGGAMVKRIGTSARREIESLLGTRTHLRLFVKVEPGWSRKARRVRALGYG